jgi:hypothetical protein
MQKISPGDLLTIVIALSAYLATIRLLAIQRLNNSSISQDRKNELKGLLRLIAIADIPLITSVILLCVYLFWQDFTGVEPSVYLAKTAIGCFLISITLLGVYHFGEWKKSFKPIR